MKFLQYLYTSCKKGQSSSAGFQVYALSEGLTEDECMELERLGAYVPALNLPTRPDQEQIQSLFPVNFQFFKLRSGRDGILQSCYRGQDYSGRYGNYFIHALVSESGQFTDYPVLFWQHPDLKAGLTPEEENITSTPEPLPILQMEPYCSLETLAEKSGQFLAEHENGAETLCAMTAAVLESNKNRRRLVLTLPHAEAGLWISALQLAFPLHLAHLITFTFYTPDPDNSPALISVTPREGGRFAFSARQRESDYFIFDLINGESSARPKPYYFESLVQNAVFLGGSELTEFHSFVDSLGLVGFAELEPLSLLFRAFMQESAMGSEQWKQASLAQWQQALAWLTGQENVQKQAYLLISETLHKATEKQIQSLEQIQEAELLHDWSLFLLGHLNANSDQSRILSLVLERWLKQDKAAILESFFQNLCQQRSDSIRLIQTWFISSGLELLKKLLDCHPDSLGAVFAFLQKILRMLELTEPELDSLSDRQYSQWLQHAIQTRLSQEPELLTEFLLQGTEQSFNFRMEILIPIVSEWPESRQIEFMTGLYRPDSDYLMHFLSLHYGGPKHGVYYQVLLMLLRTSSAPIEFFQQLIFPLCQRYPDYGQELNIWVKELLHHVPDINEEQLSQLAEQTFPILESALKEKLIQHYNQTFSFNRLDDAGMRRMQTFTQFRSRFPDLRLQPDRLGLLEYLMTLEEALEKKPPPDFNGISSMDYVAFLRIALGNIVQSKEQYKLIARIALLNHPTYSSDFFQELEKVISKSQENKFGFPSLILSLIWLQLQSTESPSFSEPLKQCLLRMFQMQPRWFKQLEKYAKNPAPTTPTELESLQKLHKYLLEMASLLKEKKEPGLLGHIKGLAGGFFSSRKDHKDPNDK